jgi:hypothetical protein
MTAGRAIAAFIKKVMWAAKMEVPHDKKAITEL